MKAICVMNQVKVNEKNYTKNNFEMLNEWNETEREKKITQTKLKI